MPAKASTWTGFFNAIGAAAAGVAVVSSIVAVITLFATKTELRQLEKEAKANLQEAKSELEFLKCQAIARLDLVDANTALLFHDQGAFNARLVLVNNNAPEQEKERLKHLIEGYEKNSTAARQQQATANDRLANCDR